MNFPKMNFNDSLRKSRKIKVESSVLNTAKTKTIGCVVLIRMCCTFLQMLVMMSFMLLKISEEKPCAHLYWYERTGGSPLQVVSQRKELPIILIRRHRVDKKNSSNY